MEIQKLAERLVKQLAAKEAELAVFRDMVEDVIKMAYQVSEQSNKVAAQAERVAERADNLISNRKGDVSFARSP